VPAQHSDADLAESYDSLISLNAHLTTLRKKVLGGLGFIWQPQLPPLKEFRSLTDVNRQSLFGLAASRFVEDMLADLNRPDIFLGPIGG
jgi:hypothetical protein